MKLLVQFVRDTLTFIADLRQKREWIWALARREVEAKYTESVLGLAWALLQPLIMLAVFWAVFSLGFRVGHRADVPFVVWLGVGLAPWYLIIEVLNGNVGIISQHAYLVKKIAFRVSFLPVAKVIAALIGHGAFFVVLVLLMLLNGVYPSFFWLQALYYLFALCIFLLALSWLISALNVFLKDTAQFLQIILQLSFWLTPILWHIGMVPERYHPLLQLNPFAYIVQGYRDSFLLHTWVWAHSVQTLYFWTLTLLMLSASVWTFRRLRPHFAEVI